MLGLLLVLLAAEFPSTSKTAWMRPESFHLAIGMSRSETMEKLEAWKPKKTEKADEMVIEYGDDKAVTLQFHKDRLRSIRFELFCFLPDSQSAFEEEKAFLRESYGKPKKLKSKTIVAYTDTLPNVMVVLSNDPKSENGSKGLGMLVVRYYDPLPPR